MLKYPLFRGEGPLGSVSGFEGMGIYRSGLDPDSTWPDVQLNLISVTPGKDFLMKVYLLDL